MRELLWAALLALTGAAAAGGEVSFERIVRANQEPGNWLTYSRTYDGQRYSPLAQVHRDNVNAMKVQWIYQMDRADIRGLQMTPLVVDGVMYTTKPPADIVAIDVRTGRPFWTYRGRLAEKINSCCGPVNKGLAILGDRLYYCTLDSRLLALDAKTGNFLWETEVADYRTGATMTVAPVAVKDKVIVGISGGEYGIRGFLDAYNANTGKQEWRFYTIPGPGEPGHETWGGDSWMTGGAGTWAPGTYDPELNLLYWGVGNPGPDYNGDSRPGDNLYSDCVLALNPDNGKLKWYFQFTPHDTHDWDAAQIPVLVDADFRGRHRRLMLFANRNAFYYILDRETGEFLLAKQFAKQSWADGIDAKGRPLKKPNSDPTPNGNPIQPEVQGATNWYSPSYNPLTGMLYVNVWEATSVYQKLDTSFSLGNRFIGGLPRRPEPEEQIEKPWGAIRALDALTGEKKWEHRLYSVSKTGVLSTAGKLVFAGSAEGQFFAFDAMTGEQMWRFQLGAPVNAAPITYLVDGKQQVAIAAGRAILAFGVD
ncbi:MAG: PQQ-dependent dehydrogenase, methanol/ethanol family [Acidobacteria bacterium]|nr:PQQ-dependent dehydrogenase, methanol/ethanol family [Acidobacteriota bacterium]